MKRPQRIVVVVALGVFFLVLHQIGVDYYEAQEDPSLNVILLFRIRTADLFLLLLWTLSSLAVFHKW